MVGDEELVEGIEKGTKVRVKTPVTVFHSPKLGDFNLEGKEGEVLEASHLLSLQLLKHGIAAYRVSGGSEMLCSAICAKADLRWLWQVVSLYKGKQTSANLPYKVVFMIPQEEKDIKLVAHLVSSLALLRSPAAYSATHSVADL